VRAQFPIIDIVFQGFDNPAHPQAGGRQTQSLQISPTKDAEKKFLHPITTIFIRLLNIIFTT